MTELFEFEVHREHGVFTDAEIDRFIERLESYSLFWGGGGNERKVQGVISVGDETNFDAEAILSLFHSWFRDDDQIVIKILSTPKVLKSDSKLFKA